MSPRALSAVLACAVLAILGPAAVAPTVVSAAGGEAHAVWSYAGNLQAARSFAPAVRLGDGSVLTAGGWNGFSFFASAERWDPASHVWASAGSIGQAVYGQVASLLPDGRALFAGGTNDTSYYGFGDVYDPAAKTWTQTPVMAHSHAFAAGATLANGDVLVVGGYDGGASLLTPTVDVYSASAGTWSAGPDLPGEAGRYAMTATTLGDGTVLLAGGNSGAPDASAALSTVDIYSTATGWSAAASMQVARFDQAAVLLADGRVLVAGGSDGNGAALASAEIYDPATGQWTLTGNMLSPRFGLTLSMLGNGRVLAVGGYSSATSPALASAEIYDPTTGAWSATASLTEGRRYQSATVLADGRVLVAGGHGAGIDSYLASSEVYTPAVPYTATTFHPITPARILDTRSGIGLGGVFSNRVPRMLQVTGRGGVPAGAVAVTGILTVTGQTKQGFISVGPIATSTPGSSNLNFPAADNRANNVTVALDVLGRLAAVYIPNGDGTTQLVFDVTGYFLADDNGATFKPLAPGRVLDSRNGTGAGGIFRTGVAKTFQVTGKVGVPAEAVAVTGNLTLVRPTGKGWAFVGPSIPADPTKLGSSTVNAPAKDIRADGVTVALGSGGTLSAVWVGTKGSTADLVFDVTGYFVQGLGGAHFVPMDPVRLVDTRIGLPFMGPVRTGAPATVPVAGHGGIPTTAVGISGNLTVTGQTYLGYLAVSPRFTGPATTSTLNFPAGDNRANGFDSSLAPDGSLSVVYQATPKSSTTHFVLDVAGYFTP
jgi:N-acetylneuraminic acid mutarotase